MLLNWKHTEGDTTTVVQIPIKLKKSVNKDYGFGGNLICNKCETQLSQKYVCVCGEEYTIGQVEKRKDKMTGIIYTDKDKKEFMEIKIDDNLMVSDEIKPIDIIDNFSFIDGEHFEIYNNEDKKASDTIAKVHNFLHTKGLVLLVSFGYHGKDRAGIIISEKDRLTLAELRDYNLIKEQIHLDIQSRTSPINDLIKGLTESRIPELYKEFLQLVENGEKLEKPKIAKEKPIEMEIDFLKNF